MDTEAGRRAVARGMSWRDEALTRLCEAAGLEVPREGWPLLGLTDAHPRLQHVYVARHVEDARVWDAMQKARREVSVRASVSSKYDPARSTVKPPVILMRVRGAPGRRVGHYALLEAAHANRALDQLLHRRIEFPVILKDVEGVAPRVIPALQALIRMTIGTGDLVHIVRGRPKAPRPSVALMTFDGYVKLVVALTEAGIW